MTVIVAFSYLFEIVAVLACIHYLYGKTLKFDLLTVSYILLEVFWMCNVFMFHLDQTWTLLMHLITIVYCGIKYGFHIKQILINNILCVGILMLIQALLMLAFSKIFTLEKMGIFENFEINLALLLITVLGLRRCKLKKLSDVLQYNDKIIWQALIIVSMCAVCFLLMYKQSRKFDVFYFAVLGVSIGLIIVVAIDIGKHKVKTKEIETELRLHILYEASFKELIDEISAKQHEFDNHINAIYSQHRMYKTYDELVDAQKKYCNEVMEDNHFNKILSKGNPIILCFLYSKFAEMKRKGIEVTYKINIENLESAMPIHKMVELLGNLINNAMEATEKRESGKINIIMSEEIEKIFLEVANESDVVEEKKIKEFFKKGYSEKGKKRGYGLYNVKRICEECNAVCVCKNEKRDTQNWMVFKIIINK